RVRAGTARDARRPDWGAGVRSLRARLRADRVAVAPFDPAVVYEALHGLLSPIRSLPDPIRNARRHGKTRSTASFPRPATSRDGAWRAAGACRASSMRFAPAKKSMN